VLQGARRSAKGPHRACPRWHDTQRWPNLCVKTLQSLHGGIIFQPRAQPFPITGKSDELSQMCPHHGQPLIPLAAALLDQLSIRVIDLPCSTHVGRRVEPADQFSDLAFIVPTD
jgi:hypothetical protein